MFSLSVVVPVFNSQETLPVLIQRLQPVLESHTLRYEVILVNDGSRDRSWKVICQLAQEYKWVRGINMMRNYGQHNALLCGLRATRYEVTVTMDDDLQHPPEQIPLLLEKLSEGYDVVYGVATDLSHSVWRSLLSTYTKWALSTATGIKAIRNVGAFRALRTDLRKAFAHYQSPEVLLDVLLAWGTTDFAAVEVEHEARQVGKSSYEYEFGKMFNLVILMLTGFSTAPLRLTSWVGFGFTLLGGMVLAYVLITYLFRGSIEGWPFLASSISIFSGAQLFALGIIGEYLGRIFTRSLDRPTYVVDQATDETGE